MRILMMIGAAVLSCAALPQEEGEDLGKVLGRDPHILGKMKLDDREAEVYFTEHEKGYVARFIFGGDAAYQEKALGARFKMWLITNAGGALKLVDRPPAGKLVWVGNQVGGTADCSFVFKHELERKDLARLVVAIDEKYEVYPIPPR